MIAVEPTRPSPGIVYTFYSFKGGVGRSMALANVAAVLSSWGRRVLVVDWDLEAPGIEKYFEPWTKKSRSTTSGLVDLIDAFAGGRDFDWHQCLLYATPMPSGNPISLITAGCTDDRYSEKLRGILWDRLFSELGFGLYLEKLRNEWIREFDAILVDSRTGVTDIGGICTIHLPDILVTLFTTNEQSISGVKDVMQRARNAHAQLPLDRRRLLAVPIVGKDEGDSEYERAKEWRERAARDLEGLFEDWIPKDETPARVLDYLRIPYKAFWSFGERLPVAEEDPNNPKTLAHAYQLLARLLDTNLDWGALQSNIAAPALEEKLRTTTAELESAQRRIDQATRERVVLSELPAVMRSVRIRRNWLRFGCGVGVFYVVTGIGLLIFSAGYKDQTENGFSALVFGIPLTFYFLWRLRRRRRQLERLDEERARFEMGGPPYVGVGAEHASTLFVLRLRKIGAGEPVEDDSSPSA